MGKFAHALAAVARPRLDREDNASVIRSKIQVAFNNVARSITSAQRRDHIAIKDLLDLAGIESANRMVVKAIVAETWSCYHSDHGQDGARNHVGSILFTGNKTATAKTTQSARTGQMTVPLRGGHLCHACRQRDELAGHATQRVYEGGCKEGGIRFGKSLTTLVKILPARLDLPPAACGVFPAGRGASPAGRGAFPQECGPSPLRSWAHHLLLEPSRLLLFSGSALAFSRNGRRESAAARNKQDLTSFA
jgi:hypothetical protein